MTVARAQEKTFEVLLGGGITSANEASNKFNQKLNPGFTGKVAVGYFLTSQFALAFNFSYNKFTLEDEFSPGWPAWDPERRLSFRKMEGGDLSILEMAGISKFHFLPASSTASPYVLGGTGLAFLSISDVTAGGPGIHDALWTAERETATDFLLTAGIGMKFNFHSHFGVFVEATYSLVFSKDNNTTYMPIRAGLSF